VYPDTFAPSAERSFYPREYPGGVAEAAYEMGVWDGAINELSSRGIVDEHRVGIIGFSRSGWYTEFSLAHSRHRYRAATVTDNVQYSVGTYWLLHSNSALHSSETMYGGPPYGKTLENWEKYSISFNLDKIHTPLLMEALGHGMPYNDWRAAPSFLATTFEVFTGLNRLEKPVELVYYPIEDHQPDHPQARLATLQRNVDWYRFWLQGYERLDPEDKEQYVRWQRLRELNEASR